MVEMLLDLLTMLLDLVSSGTFGEGSAFGQLPWHKTVPSAFFILFYLFIFMAVSAHPVLPLTKS